MDWERIAKEYEQEIENLWHDMLEASRLLEERMPKCVGKAQGLLDRSVESSEKIVHDIKKLGG